MYVVSYWDRHGAEHKFNADNIFEACAFARAHKYSFGFIRDCKGDIIYDNLFEREDGYVMFYKNERK